MPIHIRLSLALALALAPIPAPASDGRMTCRPIIIAHRGASADRPEHTLAAYRLAIEQGADFIEPDLVPTRDGHLVARHENEISGTTDVAQHPAFAARRTQKIIDGQTVTGWFTEDFTLAELKALRARERLPMLRPSNTAHDGKEDIPTLEEIIQLVKTEERRTGRRIGLYPETKHPAYFESLGLDTSRKLINILIVNGYKTAQEPVFIQSFEIGNLKLIRKLTPLRLIQLVAHDGGPADAPSVPYRQMLTTEGLKKIASYADGIGAEKSLIIPRREDGSLGQPTTLVADARRAGLLVHAWTFRPENHFLPAGLRAGDNPIARGDTHSEILAFAQAGIDGLFSDSVDAAVAALNGGCAAENSQN